MAWFKKRQITEPNKEIIPVPKQQDDELIAVLAAAVAAFMGTAPGNIVVRSYRKVNSAWRRSAREMQILNR
jgi:hypothetical protein